VTVSYFSVFGGTGSPDTLKALIDLREETSNIQISFQTAPYSIISRSLQTQIAVGRHRIRSSSDYGTFYGYATKRSS